MSAARPRAAAGAGGRCPPSHAGLPPGYFDEEEGRALIERIGALPGSRVLVAVAGPPGAGKSTLAEALVARVRAAALVPMDGFHLDDRLLGPRGLLARKGAAETFDAAGFAALHARLRIGAAEVMHPVFDRGREIAIAGAGSVPAEARVVLIEGNYLLLAEAPWEGLRYDLTIALELPRAVLEQRLTARWQQAGLASADIAAHLANDLANAAVVSGRSRAADMVLRG